MPHYRRTKEELITPPACEPVSLEEARAQCHLYGTTEDDKLTALITVARQTIEDWCWCSLISQTWQYWWDRPEWEMAMPRPPLQKVNSLKYIPPQGTSASLSTCPDTIYEVSERDGIAFLRLQYLQTWPVWRGYRDDWMAEVVSGYGDDPEDVPAPVRQAILMLIAHLFMHHGDDAAELPPGIAHLLNSYRFKEF